MISTTSALIMSTQWFVIAPLPNEAASPATVELCHQAKGAHELHQQIGFLVVERRAAEAGDGLGAVRRAAVHRRLERLVACFLYARRDALEGPVPRLLFPGRAPWLAVEDLLQPPGIVDDLDPRRAFAAQGAFADGVARVTLDVDDLTLLCGDDLAAADAAERAHRRRRRGAAGLERRHRRSAPGLRHRAGDESARRQSAEELPARRPRGPVHLVVIVHGLTLACGRS
jgi:hypothetical protein